MKKYFGLGLMFGMLSCSPSNEMTWYIDHYLTGKVVQAEKTDSTYNLKILADSVMYNVHVQDPGDLEWKISEGTPVRFQEGKLSIKDKNHKHNFDSTHTGTIKSTEIEPKEYIK